MRENACSLVHLDTLEELFEKLPTKLLEKVFDLLVNLTQSDTVQLLPAFHPARTAVASAVIA